MRIINFIKNLWTLLSIVPKELSKIVDNIDSVYIFVNTLTQVSKIQDAHQEVIQQIAVNQYTITTTQSEILHKVSQMERAPIKKKKASSALSLNEIFHKDDDDDIFH